MIVVREEREGERGGEVAEDGRRRRISARDGRTDGRWLDAFSLPRTDATRRASRSSMSRRSSCMRDTSSFHPWCLLELVAAYSSYSIAIAIAAVGRARASRGRVGRPRVAK